MCSTTPRNTFEGQGVREGAKETYAKKYDLKVHTLIGVRDADKGEIHYYGSKEPGLTGAEVSDKTFDYLGKVKI